MSSSGHSSASVSPSLGNYSTSAAASPINQLGGQLAVNLANNNLASAAQLSAALAASQFLSAFGQLGAEPRVPNWPKELADSRLLAAANLNETVQLAAASNAHRSALGHQSGAASQAGAPGRADQNVPVAHSIPHPHSHHALSHPVASLLSNPHYQTVRTKYSTRRYSRRRVGPDEAMADPAIRATVQKEMAVVPKTILIVLKHRLTVQTAITLACGQTGERLRKGAIQKKLEAMFREPGAVESFLAEYDHP